MGVKRLFQPKIRAGGKGARLESNAGLLGLCAEWKGTACQTRHDPDDLLVVSSDGVTDAPRGEEDFGEDRLIETLLPLRNEPAGTIVSRLPDEVQEFSTGDQTWPPAEIERPISIQARRRSLSRRSAKNTFRRDW